jgi:DNA-binding response OmpR family regulator
MGLPARVVDLSFAHAEPFVLNPARRTVLVVDRSAAVAERVERMLAGTDAGVVHAACAAAAHAVLDNAPVDVALLSAAEAGDDILELLDRLRSTERDGVCSVLALIAPGDRRTLLDAFRRGADDVLEMPGAGDDGAELRARLVAKLDRPSHSRRALTREPATGALTEVEFRRLVAVEHERLRRGGKTFAIAFVSLYELPELEARLGPRVRDAVLSRVVALTAEDGRRLDLVGVTRRHVAVLLPETPAKGARIRLERLSRRLSALEVPVDGELVRLTPAVGYATAEADVAPEALEERAWAALRHGAEQLDLCPTRWDRRLSGPHPGGRGRIAALLAGLRTPLQILVQQLLCLLLPFFTYMALDRAGLDVTGAVYLVVVGALVFTSAGIWAECLAALPGTEPPRRPKRPYPPATAIIAAYLPNEAATVLDTVRAFLRQDYPDLQIILAYNSPAPMAIEAELHDLASRAPNFLPLRVEGSVSKAQNVNAALLRARGEMVAVFDADHHPRRGSFRRAWRWISHGADVVQGHCVVRNGGTNVLTRVVAAEFEVIYGVTHPGRARLHGFGIFGGSNGYWRTDLLRDTRMRGFMLTEDIDSSMRVICAGARVVSDPGLVSTELAPVTPRALWGQRMRWAQGWSQVSIRHLLAALRSPSLSLRQKAGMVHLLGWRELFPWLSLQVAPVLGYWMLRGEPAIGWFVPVFVCTTLFTLSAGPMQAWTAWRKADRTLRPHGRWFWLYLVLASLGYTEIKNLIARTAHIKEAMREKTWKVTPRPAPAPHVLHPVAVEA